MGIIKNVLGRFGYVKAGQRSQAYYGTNVGRLYASWKPGNDSADRELRYNLKMLRARSRDLQRNNDYVKRYFRLVKTNVIGPNGIILQSRITNDSGKPDKVANDLIETAWGDWGKKGICEVTGRFSFRDLQGAVIKHIVRDGEILVRRVRGYSGNKYRYALQPIEADHLDEKYNQNFKNGNKIKMGIELDPMGRAIAYHVYKTHPGEFGLLAGQQRDNERMRIPADEILHLFLPEPAIGR